VVFVLLQRTATVEIGEVVKLASEFSVNLWSQRTSLPGKRIGSHSPTHTPYKTQFNGVSYNTVLLPADRDSSL